MFRTYIKDVQQKNGEQVLINGFVQAIRNQGKIAFLMIRDFTGLVQVVALKNENPQAYEIIESLSLESVVEIVGNVKEEKQAPGGFEVGLSELKVLSRAEPELPIPVVVEKGGEETDVSKRFDWRWIDLRKKDKGIIFEVWNKLEVGFRDYLIKNNFTQMYAPSLMSTPSESGAEVFEVDYFDRKAYLAQSPQFYKQAAMAAGMERVFMVGPVFRAEPSYTTRHMTEFTGWDFEMSYIKDHHEVMAHLQGALQSAFKSVKESLLPDLEGFEEEFPKITFFDAKELLKSNGVVSEKEYDLSPEEERALGRLMKEKTNSDFVFLTDYHVETRPFYHMRYDDQPELTKSYDLLYKGLEIVTGAQREHRPEVLITQAKEKEMDLESIDYYINFFRYGCPPHGGAGIGPNRIVMKLLDLPSVKESAFLPRDVKRLTP